MTPQEIPCQDFVQAVYIVTTLISLAGVLVALDAQARGVSRGMCVLWFLGIVIFPPSIFMYFFIRSMKQNKTGFGGKFPGTSGRSQKENTTKLSCPYCGQEYEKDQKLCPGCGRFL